MKNKTEANNVYIFILSIYRGKMTPSLIPRKIKDFASLGGKIINKIYDSAILRNLSFLPCVVARDMYWRYN
jgi:hypothetical protein